MGLVPFPLVDVLSGCWIGQGRSVVVCGPRMMAAASYQVGIHHDRLDSKAWDVYGRWLVEWKRRLGWVELALAVDGG